MTGIKDEPFVFFDVLDGERLIKVIHPRSEEILWTDLATLDAKPALEIGCWLHSASEAATSKHGFPTEVVAAIKTQCGF